MQVEVFFFFFYIYISEQGIYLIRRTMVIRISLSIIVFGANTKVQFAIFIAECFWLSVSIYPCFALKTNAKLLSFLLWNVLEISGERPDLVNTGNLA